VRRRFSLSRKCRVYSSSGEVIVDFTADIADPAPKIAHSVPNNVHSIADIVQSAADIAHSAPDIVHHPSPASECLHPIPDITPRF
jgi:hypothetical protein